jgi:MoaA/NifB/PqqE/SkfB family radical SAM enzyme
MISWSLASRSARSLGRMFVSNPRLVFRTLRKRYCKQSALLDYHLLGIRGASHSLEKITIELTHRCNLRCRMCSNFSNPETPTPRGIQYARSEELTYEQLAEFVDEASALTSVFGLTGGEPTLSPYCLEIIRHIKNKGLFCGLTTNGTQLHRLAEEIVDSRLDWISISLDGPEQVHDDIRGVPGTYRRLMEGVEELQKFKNKHGRKEPKIGIKFTLVGDNYQYAEDIVKAAIRMKAVLIDITHLFFWTEETVQRQRALYGDDVSCYVANTDGLKGMDPLKIYEALQELKKQAWPIHIRFLPDLSLEETLTYYQQPSCFVHSDRCLRPWLNCSLLPNGDIVPCLSYVAGNIKDKSFSQIWNSARFRHFRRLLRKNRLFPACARCCGLYEY